MNWNGWNHLSRTYQILVSFPTLQAVIGFRSFELIICILSIDSHYNHIQIFYWNDILTVTLRMSFTYCTVASSYWGNTKREIHAILIQYVWAKLGYWNWWNVYEYSSCTLESMLRRIRTAHMVAATSCNALVWKATRNSCCNQDILFHYWYKSLGGIWIFTCIIAVLLLLLLVRF